MGIYYLSGLGLRPGGATVPLQYIYLIVKAAKNGNKQAINFFAKSGEYQSEGVQYPENIIIFTSKEVISGEKSPIKGMIDDWYNLRLNTLDSVPKIVIKSLDSLVQKCNFSKIPSPWIDNIYFLSVKHDDFKDCYGKIFTTIKALSSKEVWINFIGGSNQITLSFFLASALTGVATKGIYIFQDDNKIHPDIDRPNFEAPKLDIPPKAWYEFPFFWLGIESEILRNIEYCFSDNDITNRSQIDKVLLNSDLTTQFISKLQSARLIRIDGKDPSKVYKGPGFSVTKQHKIEVGVKNFPKWKAWARKKGILYRVNFDQNFLIEKV